MKLHDTRISNFFVIFGFIMVKNLGKHCSYPKSTFPQFLRGVSKLKVFKDFIGHSLIQSTTIKIFFDFRLELVSTVILTPNMAYFIFHRPIPPYVLVFFECGLRQTLLLSRVEIFSGLLYINRNQTKFSTNLREHFFKFRF